MVSFKIMKLKETDVINKKIFQLNYFIKFLFQNTFNAIFYFFIIRWDDER